MCGGLPEKTYYTIKSMIAHALSAKDLATRLLDHIVNPLIGLMAIVAILLFIVTAINLSVHQENQVTEKTPFIKMGYAIFGMFSILSVDNNRVP